MTVMMVMLVLLGAAQPPQPPTTRPDFSGIWVFDPAATGAHVQRSSIKTPSPLLGDECTITQTAAVLTTRILIGGQTVTATYRLDGEESRNLSPGRPGQGDIPIRSRARWNGQVLEVTTSSESPLDGKVVPVESLRRFWLGEHGRLVIERTGSPSEIVPASVAVYQRK